MNTNTINKLFTCALLLSLCMISTNSSYLRFTSKNNSQLITSKTNGIIPSQWFNIVTDGGNCISAKNGNGPLTQQPCGESDDLVWSAIKTNGGYTIKSRNGKVIDNSASGSNIKNPVFGWYSHKGANQVWEIESFNNGKNVHLRNPQSGKCLDDEAVKTVGGKFWIWNCFAENVPNRNQWFKFVPVTEWFNIVTDGGNCISAKNGNGPLTQQPCGTSDDLAWTKIKTNGGYIIQSKNGKVMDNSASGNKIRNPVIGWNSHKGANQVWEIESFNNGKNVHLRNPQSGKCLDDEAVKTVGGKFWIWNCFAENVPNRNQWFKFVTI